MISIESRDENSTALSRSTFSLTILLLRAGVTIESGRCVSSDIGVSVSAIGEGSTSESALIESVKACSRLESSGSSLSRAKAGTSDDSNNRAMIYNSDVLNVGVESAYKLYYSAKLLKLRRISPKSHVF